MLGRGSVVLFLLSNEISYSEGLGESGCQCWGRWGINIIESWLLHFSVSRGEEERVLLTFDKLFREKACCIRVFEFVSVCGT